MDDADRAVIELAAMPFRWEAEREKRAAALGYTLPRFWARVGVLLEDPVAERDMPAEVRRLRRLRDGRRAMRCSPVAPSSHAQP